MFLKIDMNKDLLRILSMFVCVCVDVHNACVCIRGLTVQIAHGLICIGFRVTVLVRKKKELLP